MSLAWETTDQDVLNVLARMTGKMPDPTEAERIHRGLDTALIENAALRGIEMNEQTNYAYQEIERQIRVDMNLSRPRTMPYKALVTEIRTRLGSSAGKTIQDVAALVGLDVRYLGGDGMMYEVKEK